jgi:CDP-diacylglycerol--glycerol-3-phosphate 3-phosphatidyltransferase
VLSIGLVFARGASLGDFQLLAPSIYVLAALSTFTVIQRVWHVKGELAADASKRESMHASGDGDVT